MSKNMAIIDETGKVLNIIICQDDELETDFLKTYTNQNPAYIDGYYTNGYFYPPQPFPSWLLDEETCRWKAPVPMPTDGKFYIWNEETVSWEEVTD